MGSKLPTMEFKDSEGEDMDEEEDEKIVKAEIGEPGTSSAKTVTSSPAYASQKTLDPNALLSHNTAMNSQNSTVSQRTMTSGFQGMQSMRSIHRFDSGITVKTDNVSSADEDDLNMSSSSDEDNSDSDSFDKKVTTSDDNKNMV